MLIAGTCEVHGVEDAGASFAVVNPYTHVAVVVGRPQAPAIAAVAERLDGKGDLLAFDENLEHVKAVLGDWEVTPAVLHLLGDSTRMPHLEPIGVGAPMARPAMAPHPLPVPSDEPDEEIVIRMITGGEVDAVDGPPDLIDELKRGTLLGKVAATFVDGRPVAFCDASTETEGLWDIGIDTLEPYRRRGYAALAVAYTVDQQGRRGRRPVWGAEEDNEASMRLASKLGFKPVDRLLVLNPPD
jgi:GNAT superfamily N-acetyltransferase